MSEKETNQTTEEKPKKEKKAKKGKKEKKEKKEKAPQVKICPNCEAEIPKKAKVCPNCEAKQKGGNKLLLILVPIIVLLAAASVSIAVFSFPVALPFLSSVSDTMLGQAMGLSSKQEEAVLAVLAECGFQEVSEIRTVKEGSKRTSYAVSDYDTERFLDVEDAFVVQLLNETKTVESITFLDHDIYANGRVVSKVTDYYLGQDQRDDYLKATLSAVRARLTFPETAVFPSRSHWTYTVDGETVTVQSTVTAKDGAGKESVQAFTAQFTGDELTSLEFSEASVEASGTEKED